MVPDLHPNNAASVQTMSGIMVPRPCWVDQQRCHRMRQTLPVTGTMRGVSILPSDCGVRTAAGRSRSTFQSQSFCICSSTPRLDVDDERKTSPRDKYRRQFAQREDLKAPSDKIVAAPHMRDGMTMAKSMDSSCCHAFSLADRLDCKCSSSDCDSPLRISTCVSPNRLQDHMDEGVEVSQVKDMSQRHKTVEDHNIDRHILGELHELTRQLKVAHKEDTAKWRAKFESKFQAVEREFMESAKLVPKLERRLRALEFADPNANFESRLSAIEDKFRDIAFPDVCEIIHDNTKKQKEELANMKASLEHRLRNLETHMGGIFIPELQDCIRQCRIEQKEDIAHVKAILEDKVAAVKNTLDSISLTDIHQHKLELKEDLASLKTSFDHSLRRIEGNMDLIGWILSQVDSRMSSVYKERLSQDISQNRLVPPLDKGQCSCENVKIQTLANQGDPPSQDAAHARTKCVHGQVQPRNASENRDSEKPASLGACMITSTCYPIPE